MAEARAALVERIRAHCSRAPPAVLFDEAGCLLADVFSGKTLALDIGALESVEEKTNPETQQGYLVLVLAEGRRLGLTEAGVAFAPKTEHTGVLPELPNVVCLKDFHGLLGRLKHALYGHPDVEPTRDTAKLVLMCIAILDGAREAGFDIGREEAELEVHLFELEKRTPKGPQVAND